jgi:hypothetical protein
VEEVMINRLKNKRIEIRKKLNGNFRVFYGSQELNYVPVMEYINPRKTLNCKEKLAWNQGKGGHPGTNHPWKRFGYQIPLSNRLGRAVI